jgi:predicted MFS family arabinose efflux permease
MTRTESWPGRIALMVAHCAGMVDLVALPVWVGTLVTSYKLDPQQAGGLATLFLVGAVASSVFFAPRFNRMRGRTAASIGFGVAALAFFGVSQTTDYASMAALHALAGVAAGSGLTFTHGTIGRSANPHRLFAIVGIALGVFAIVFLGATPKLVALTGGATLFRVFAGIMLVGALVAFAAFPEPDRAGEDSPNSRKPFDAPVWFAIGGISCMALVQAMTFSFVERIGIDRGFGLDAVTGVLITLGFVNLLPAPLAALLERRWSANTVVLVGPIAQAVLALVITHAVSFAPYAAASALFVAVMIFTHTFAFGLVARLDPTGRALAATPAMLMVGAAAGPVLGGTFVKSLGYGSIGFAAIVIAALALTSFSRARRSPTVVARVEHEAGDLD